jgi:hypothetical protein
MSLSAPPAGACPVKRYTRGFEYVRSAETSALCLANDRSTGPARLGPRVCGPQRRLLGGSPQPHGKTRPTLGAIVTALGSRRSRSWQSNRDVDGARREPVVAIAIAPLAMLHQQKRSRGDAWSRRLSGVAAFVRKGTRERRREMALGWLLLGDRSRLAAAVHTTASRG